MPIDINTNLLAPRPVQSTVPQQTQNFNVISQLPGIYRQGQLRQGLAKCDPNDFQCMAKLLMQYGQPEEGVRAMQLATALKHQAFEEDLATKTYGLQASEAKAREALQGTELGLKMQGLQQPYLNIKSGLAGYLRARDEVLKPGLSGAKAAAYGAPAGEINIFAGSVADGLGLTGKAREDFIARSVPLGDDSVETKKAKLNALENRAAGLGGLAERVGAGSASNYIIPPYVEPPTTSAPGVTGPPTAFNRQPNVGSPTSPEAATAAPSAVGNLPLIPGSNKPVPAKLLPIFHTHGLEYNTQTHVIRDVVTKTLYNDNGDLVGGK